MIRNHALALYNLNIISQILYYIPFQTPLRIVSHFLERAYRNPNKKKYIILQNDSIPIMEYLRILGNPQQGYIFTPSAPSLISNSPQQIHTLNPFLFSERNDNVGIINFSSIAGQYFNFLHSLGSGIMGSTFSVALKNVNYPLEMAIKVSPLIRPQEYFIFMAMLYGNTYPEILQYLLDNQMIQTLSQIGYYSFFYIFNNGLDPFRYIWLDIIDSLGRDNTAFSVLYWTFFEHVDNNIFEGIENHVYSPPGFTAQNILELVNALERTPTYLKMNAYQKKMIYGLYKSIYFMFIGETDALSDTLQELIIEYMNHLVTMDNSPIRTEAIISYVASLLYLNGESPYFPIVYTSFEALFDFVQYKDDDIRTRTNPFFTESLQNIIRSNNIIPPYIQAMRPPCQFLLMEVMDGGLDDYTNTLISNINNASAQTLYQSLIDVLSLYFQIVTMFIVFNNTLRGIHADAHAGNILFKTTYEQEGKYVDSIFFNISETDIYYKVPLYLGRILKLIDMERASIKVGDNDQTITSPGFDHPPFSINRKDPINDIIRATHELSKKMRNSLRMDRLVPLFKNDSASFNMYRRIIVLADAIEDCNYRQNINTPPKNAAHLASNTLSTLISNACGDDGDCYLNYFYSFFQEGQTICPSIVKNSYCLLTFFEPFKINYHPHDERKDVIIYTIPHSPRLRGFCVEYPIPK